MPTKKLTKEEIQTYRKMLEDNKEMIARFHKGLTHTQTRFFNVVLDITDHPESTINEVAERNACHTRTVVRARDIMKQMALPFRMSDRMRGRILEDKFNGASTDLGLMKEEATRKRLSRYRNRRAKFGTDVPKLSP